MSSTNKRKDYPQSSGGESSANHIIREAGDDNVERSKATTEDGMIDKLKGKVKDVKDKIVDNTDKTAETIRRKSFDYTSTNDQTRKYEEGAAGTSSDRINDPTKEY